MALSVLHRVLLLVTAALAFAAWNFVAVALSENCTWGARVSAYVSTGFFLAAMLVRIWMVEVFYVPALDNVWGRGKKVEGKVFPMRLPRRFAV